MILNAKSILVIIAVVIFIAAAIGAKIAGIDLIALGLAVGFLAFLV
jgi:hypothetical protein